MVSILKALRLIGQAEEEDRVRLGRLAEDDSLERQIATGRFIRLGASRLRLPVYRPSRAVSTGPGQSLHFQINYVSKRAPEAAQAVSAREAAARRGRVYLAPRRGDVAVVQAAGGRYDRKARAWWVPEAQYKVAEADLGRMRTNLAKAAHRRARSGRGKAKPGRAAAFQRYVERAGPDEKGRLAELVLDAAGEPVSFGVLGDDADERAGFWDAVEAVERADGRVQCRAIVELPHELDGQELAELSRALVAPLAERGLPYHAAAHRPDVEAGSDPRNVHLHVLWSERPAERLAPHQWRFAPSKDRQARGPAWVKQLRHRSVEIINRHLDAGDAERRAQGGAGIDKRYDARSYREMGIGKLPGVHLGPGRTALERAGVPTAAGVANALREQLWENAQRIAGQNARARAALGLALRPGADPAAVERLVAAVDVAGHAGRPSKPEVLEGERLRRRTAWLESAAAAPADTERRRRRARLAADQLRGIEEASRRPGIPDALGHGDPEALAGQPGPDARAGSGLFGAMLAVARSQAASARKLEAAHVAELRADIGALTAGADPGTVAAREAERRRRILVLRNAEVRAAEAGAGPEPSAAAARRLTEARRRLAQAEAAAAAAAAAVARVGGLAPAAGRAEVLALLGANDPPVRRRRRGIER